MCGMRAVHPGIHKPCIGKSLGHTAYVYVVPWMRLRNESSTQCDSSLRYGRCDTRADLHMLGLPSIPPPWVFGGRERIYN